MKEKMCVLGLGYIGLPTALLFAKAEVNVVGVDINQKVVRTLNEGKILFNEPGLAELFEKAKENFSASTSVEEADVFLICVPTPLKKQIHVSDLTYVRNAAEMIAPVLKKGNLVILESTVPPGASEKLVIPVLEKCGVSVGDFHYVHCPERAIPGKTISEMVHNDRIVGGYDSASCRRANELYCKYVKGEIHLTDIKTAEFIKLVENTYRDVNIALANEFAQISEISGINVWRAIELANKHPRVKLLSPGPGVGGHCIAVDPWFLTEISSKWGIIQLARDINDGMPNHVIQLVRSLVSDLKEPTITVFGVAYKGNVEDTRESPAIKFIQLAENEGYCVKCYDPYVKKFDYPVLDLDAALENSDCIVIITDHKDFKSIDPVTLRMRTKNCVDARNIVDHKIWAESGFTVKVLGNGNPEFA
jgi:UDP-N-acetyl-D-mannosaminuronic acid dehydrogenase